MKVAEYILYFLTSLLFLVSCNGGGGSGATCSRDSCGLCADDREGVKICTIISSPTVSEKIILYNYGASDQDLTGWTLWDKNAEQNGSGSKSLSGTLTTSSSLEFGSLPFQINDTKEIIYLKDNSGGLIDSRSN